MTCCCTALRGVFSQTINFGQDFLRNEYPKGQWGIAWVAISWIAICLAPFYYALRTRAVDRFADAEQGGRRYSAGGPRGGFGPGHFCGWVPRYLRVPNARASCLSHSFQSVGLGLASTVGLAIANPGKLAVLGASCLNLAFWKGRRVSGDGGAAQPA